MPAFATKLRLVRGAMPAFASKLRLLYIIKNIFSLNLDSQEIFELSFFLHLGCGVNLP